MENKQEVIEPQSDKGGRFAKAAILFICFFALATGYYLMIDYVLMVFAQNLPFPYRG